jgi:hypothetical protein
LVSFNPRSEPAIAVCTPSATKKVAPSSISHDAIETISAASFMFSSRNSVGSTSRNETTSSVITIMKTNARPIATKPARRAPWGFLRPASWPTRTVAASEIPNGIMNRTAAICSAI